MSDNLKILVGLTIFLATFGLAEHFYKARQEVLPLGIPIVMTMDQNGKGHITPRPQIMFYLERNGAVKWGFTPEFERQFMEDMNKGPLNEHGQRAPVLPLKS